MAATDIRHATIEIFDMACKNTDGSNDLVAGDLVTLDPSNPISTTQAWPGVKRATTNDAALGICVDSFAKTQTGRVRVLGTAKGRASGAITAGDTVQADSLGNMKTSASGQPQIGVALTTTTTLNDPIIVLLRGAKNS